MGVPRITLIPASCILSITLSIYAHSNSPSRGSKRLQVDSPTRTTEIPASVIIRTSSSTEAFGTLVGGIIYPSIGVLLLKKPKIGAILGTIFPLIGLGVGFFVVGIENWDTMLSIMFVIDAVVVICCVLLLSKRNRF